MFKFLKATSFSFLIFVIPWTIYFAIIWSQAIQIRPDGWYAAYIPHWGDGIAHLSYMATFTYRQYFPVWHPLFLYHPFTYSFAADMIGGLITRVGVPQWLTYNWLGFFLSVIGIVFLWKLMNHLTRSSWLATLALYLFLCSGGLGFKYLVKEYFHPETKVEPDYFFVLLTQRGDTDIAWLNTIVGELIPQRAMLLALPLGAWILITWFRAFILDQKISLRRLLISGFLFGVMPVVHPHTTMYVGSCGLIWGLYYLVNRKEDLQHSTRLRNNLLLNLMAISIPALLIGGTLTYLFLTPSVSSGFFKWYPGWIAHSKSVNWLLFWWDNWGIYLPLALIGSIWFISRVQWMVVLPAWIWFCLTNLFLFQPYDWDNSKLLTWVYLILALPVLLVLRSLWKYRWWGKATAIMLFMVMILSGGLDALKMLDTKTYALQIVNNDEIALANYVRTHTSPESVFLTATTHRDWVPILTGRQILCGYLGWMWTYGINADQRVADIKTMYAGTSMSATLLHKYGVNYVVIGPEEKNEFEINNVFFSTHYPVLIDNGSTKVYKIN